MASSKVNKYDPFKKRHVIFSARCASYLSSKGHEVVSMGIDKKNPNRDAFIFVNSKQLHEDLNDYIELRQQEKERFL